MTDGLGASGSLTGTAQQHRPAPRLPAAPGPAPGPLPGSLTQPPPVPLVPPSAAPHHRLATPHRHPLSRPQSEESPLPTPA